MIATTPKRFIGKQKEAVRLGGTINVKCNAGNVMPRRNRRRHSHYSGVLFAAAIVPLSAAPTHGWAANATAKPTLVATTASGDQNAQSTRPPKDQSASTPQKQPKTGAPQAKKKQTSKPEQPLTIDQFLDRLMIAESGGRSNAKNPRSSALGPFQFIKSTWISVIERYFPDVSAKHSTTALLALRTDPKLARKAAKAYTRELAAALRRADLPDTFVNLRLAYLLGPSASVRVLSAKDDAPVARHISRSALRANPFLRRLTVAQLRQRAKRDLSLNRDAALNLKGLPGSRSTRRRPRIEVRCNLRLASCKRWLALQKRKLRARERRAARSRSKRRAAKR